MSSPSLPAAPDAIDCIVTIAGTDYYHTDRAAHRFAGLRGFTRNMESYSELHWAVVGAGPIPEFTQGCEVKFSVEISGGARKTYMVGDLSSITWGQVDHGWSIEFVATDYRRRADRLTVVARDGTGTATYNRPPSDGPLYVSSQAGMSVGQILADILTVPTNANNLDAAGIGHYTGLPSTPALPSITTADLANLTMVPPSSVTVNGTSMFAQLASLVSGWHPAYVLWIDESGYIRCTNTTTMPAKSLVIPGNAANPDPSTWPHLTEDVDGCFTALQFFGKDVRGVWLSSAEGSLTPVHSPNAAWSTTDEGNWTSRNYNGIGDEQDHGTVVGGTMTANSCSVTSADPTAHWPINFWDRSTRQGWIQFTNPAAVGAVFKSLKRITSNTALTAGGTSTITWDAQDPIDNFAYTNYQIMGNAGSIADVGRLFLAREPSTGNTGLATYVGQRLLSASPVPLAFAKGSTAFLTSTEQGFVNADKGGFPTQTLVPIEIVPALGGVRFSQPVVMQTADQWLLAQRYPANVSEGLPTDVQALIFYNRGDLTVRSPASGYNGRAFTAYGITRLLPIYLDDSFTYPGQAIQLQVLADELQSVHRDPVISGSIAYHGWPTAFDPLTLGYSLSLTIAGATSPWDGVNLPVKSVTLEWPQDGGAQHQFTFAINNERRPLRDISVYLHPLLGSANFGAGGGQMPFENAVRGLTPQEIEASKPRQHAIEGPTFDPSSLGETPTFERPPVSGPPAFERPPVERVPGAPPRASRSGGYPRGTNAAAMGGSAERVAAEMEEFMAGGDDGGEAPPPAPQRRSLQEARGVPRSVPDPGDDAASNTPGTGSAAGAVSGAAEAMAPRRPRPSLRGRRGIPSTPPDDTMAGG